MEKAIFLLSVLVQLVSWACVADSHDSIYDRGLTVCSSCVDPMDVVDAAADCISFNDSDTPIRGE